MRVFLAGATGVIGSRLLPRLLARGDAIAAMTRTPEKADALRAAGAEPVVCDVYDARALARQMVAFAPELVIHQLTDLPDRLEALGGSNAANARMRREGTRNLLDAAVRAGATRLVAQSVAWEPAGDGAAAKRELEAGVLGFVGVVIRYGQLNGPGTYYPQAPPAPPHVHIDAAVVRTVEVLDAPSQVVTVVQAPATRLLTAEDLASRINGRG